MRSPYRRKIRSILLSKRLWRKRLVFLLGAAAIGVFASLFALSADHAQELFFDLYERANWLPLVLTPALFGVSAYFTYRFFPTAAGSGIPQAIAAQMNRDPQHRRRMLGVPVLIGKVVLSVLGMAAGASLGREGPSVQLGAGIMLLCARVSGIYAQRGVVIAGAAAGVAAAFNTPLAGIVFAIEEMARSFDHRNSSIVLTAIVISGLAAAMIMGNYDYFGSLEFQFSVGHDWYAILVLGVLGGLFGAAFAQFMIRMIPLIRGLGGRFGWRHPVLFAAICGLLIAALGMATGGETFGTGYNLGHDILHGQREAVWWQAPAKFLATALSALSGIPGGIFSPSLSVGAAFGGYMEYFLPNSPAQMVVLLGMAAYFAGVTQAPITSFVIVFEITGHSAEPIPLIAASVIAAGVSHVIFPSPLYHELAKNFLPAKAAPAAGS